MPTLAAAITQTRTGLPCSMADTLAIIAANDPELHDDLSHWLAGEGPRWSDTEVHRALQDLGYRVGRQTVGRHRRGDCRCGQAC